MDLTQLANLGEFIGGIAVLATLAYLAVQMRQSNQIANADAMRNTVNTFSTYRQMLSDDGISEVWAKAKIDEPLSRKEKVQIVAVVSELTFASQLSFMDPRSAEGVNDVFPAFVATEIGTSRSLREAWSSWEREFRAAGAGFAAFADGVSKRLDAES